MLRRWNFWPHSTGVTSRYSCGLSSGTYFCGQVALTRYLKDHEAAIDHKSLEYAVRGNRIEMVEWLVENGADPAAQRFDGKFLHEVAEADGLSRIAG